jgi:dTDP-4-dehydrorhamnose reductase
VPWGTYHLTNRGETTWHDFASEIFSLAAAAGLEVPQLKAITTAEYPAAAQRPAYSVLDNSRIEHTFGITQRHWRPALEECITKLASVGKPRGTP